MQRLDGFSLGFGVRKIVLQASAVVPRVSYMDLSVDVFLGIREVFGTG